MDQLFIHGYSLGTAFWYISRGLCRVYDPIMVIGWFRPPAQANLAPNDLETYNVRNDGWCLISLGLVLLVLSRAYQMNAIRKPYVRGLVYITVFHHLTTAFGAYQHYKLESHYTVAMWIGVWVNAFLVGVGGLTALAVGT